MAAAVAVLKMLRMTYPPASRLPRFRSDIQLMNGAFLQRFAQMQALGKVGACVRPEPCARRGIDLCKKLTNGGIENVR
jgi:hypothetical protein